jgi:hypothetical protein
MVLLPARSSSENKDPRVETGTFARAAMFTFIEPYVLLVAGKCGGMMATAIQNNGIESLANGNINHVEVNEEHVEPSDVTTNSSADGIISSEAEPPEIDIVINNVVCSFSVRCHLNLRQIALNGANVEYRRENGVCLLC